MRRGFGFFLGAIICWTGALFAYSHPVPGKLSFEGEFLYLYPSIDDTFFVIDGGPPSVIFLPNGKRKNNDFKFKPGFRIGGTYAFCKCNQEFQIYYTYLNADENKTVNGTHLWATVGTSDFATFFTDYSGLAASDLHLQYQRGDVFFDQQFWTCCGLKIYIQEGLEVASLHLHEKYIFQSALLLGTIDQKSHTWGIGPQVGLEFDYDISCVAGCAPGRITLNAYTSGSILASQTHVKQLHIVDGISFLDTSDQHTWRLVPAFHAKAGLNYATAFSCFAIAFEVGYEINCYSRGLNRVIFPDDFAPGLSFSHFTNFDVQGLYGSVAISF